MELNQFVLTKDKSYFNIPVQEGKGGIVITQFKPDQFNPSDDLKVIIRKELKDSVENTEPVSLFDFKEQYVAGRQKIGYFNEHGEKYLLITLHLGKEIDHGKFSELEKLDPDKIGNIRIHLEYKYYKEPVNV